MSCYEILILLSDANQVHVWNLGSLLKLCIPVWVGPWIQHQIMKHFGNVDYCLLKLGFPGWVGATGVG